MEKDLLDVLLEKVEERLKNDKQRRCDTVSE
jgi:hypothetical protein